LAIKSGIPIVPIAISGSRDIMPKDKLTVTSGEIRMRMDPPIKTENFSLKDRESLMKGVRETITKNFRSISQKRGEEKP
jgi:1-acyl-sn-glycerol-3-phosphate acyltransferase